MCRTPAAGSGRGPGGAGGAVVRGAHSARARASRACSAACSARRESRRASATWCARRWACASPRRADNCARARSSCIKFIFVLRFVRSFLVVGASLVGLGAGMTVRVRVTACAPGRVGPGGRRARPGGSCAGPVRRSGPGAGAGPPPDASAAASVRALPGDTWLVLPVGGSLVGLVDLVGLRGGRSGRHLALARATAGALAGDHHSVLEQLTA